MGLSEPPFKRGSIPGRRSISKLIALFLFLAIVPMQVEGGDCSMNVQTVIDRSIEGLRAKTKAHADTWRLGQEENWSIDQDRGVIVFSFADGTVAAAPVQVVGTYNPDDGTFLWGWDHPSIEEALQAHAKQVKAFGEKHGIKQFMTQQVKCTEKEAWKFTPVAVHLAEANGAYRADAGGPLVFVTFGEIKLNRE